MAIDYAHKELDATKVSLGVFENNPPAIHCYEAVGFKQVQIRKTESYTCLGEIWNCIERSFTNLGFNGHAPRADFRNWGNNKTPDFTFSDVKSGVYFSIC